MGHGRDMSDQVIDALKERVQRLEDIAMTNQKNIATIMETITGLKENYNLSKLMIQWIIAPLVLILGALVGVKIAFPGI
jgi:uroporphyrinogen-III decarboxylase